MERPKLGELPSKIVLEWFLSGSCGGRDRGGVAVRLNLEKCTLESDFNFPERVALWEGNHGMKTDRFTLAELPTLPLLNAYLEGEAYYDLETHTIQMKDFNPTA